MTQEEKQLLIKELCTRLPYKVIVEIISYAEDTSTRPWFGELSCKDLDYFMLDVAYKSIRPYLRPMSSMTDKEHDEWYNYHHEIELKEVKSNGNYLEAAILGESASIDWLNVHHFDYHGLIEKGLALEAPEGMYKIN